jgi:hypothetical protein
MIFKTLDRRLGQFGYIKVSDTNYGVRYNKIEDNGYIHAVDIMHKQSGKTLLYSYDATNSLESYAPQVALEEEEIRLFLKKLRQFKRRRKRNNKKG